MRNSITEALGEEGNTKKKMAVLTGIVTRAAPSGQAKIKTP